MRDIVTGVQTFIIAAEDGHAYYLNTWDFKENITTTLIPVPYPMHPRDVLASSSWIFRSTQGLVWLDKDDWGMTDALRVIIVAFIFLITHPYQIKH